MLLSGQLIVAMEVTRFTLPFTYYGDRFVMSPKMKGPELLRFLEDHGTLHEAYMPPQNPSHGSPRDTLLRVMVITYDDVPKVYGLRCHTNPLNSYSADELNAMLAEHMECGEDEQFVWGWTQNAYPEFCIRSIFWDRNGPVRVNIDYFSEYAARILTAWKVPKADDYLIADFRVDSFSRNARIPCMLFPKPLTRHLTTSSGEFAAEDLTATVTRALRPYCDPHGRDPATILRDVVIIPGLRHYSVDMNISYVFLDEDAIVDAGFKDYTIVHVHPSASIARLLSKWTNLAIELARNEEQQRRSLSSFFTFCHLGFDMMAEASDDYMVDIIIFQPGLTLHLPIKHLYTPDLESLDNSIRNHLSIQFAGKMTPKRYGFTGEWDLVLSSLTEETQRTHASEEGVAPCVYTWLHPHQSDAVKRMVDLERKPHGFFSALYTKTSGPLWYNPMEREVFHPGTALENAASGGFLADEPGMGKTRTVIALCLQNAAMDPERRATFICVQASILGQWVQELTTVAPHLKVYVYHGSAARTAARETIATTPDALVRDYDIVLTTYATYRADVDILSPYAWHRIVLDESHTISDWMARSPLRARYRWCVSATPMTNIHRQFIALQIPLMRPMNGCIKYFTSLLFYILSPLMIRRSRECLLLPPIADEMVAVTFTEEERTAYISTLHSVDRRHWSTAQRMRYYNLLRDICTLGPSHHRFRHVQDEIAPDSTLVAPDDDVCAICMNDYERPALTPCGHWFCSECLAMALARSERCPMCRSGTRVSTLRYGVSPGYTVDDASTTTPPSIEEPPLSSKMHAMVTQVRSLLTSNTSNKILICTHSMECLRELRNLIEPLTKVRVIHGSVPAAQRTSAIRTFQSEATRVMIVTYRSASAGINLTAANHVILVSPNLNTDVETQLIGRAHRFGQTKPVHVYRYFMQNSVEEAILLEKKSLSELFV